jgi:hypothetical protein
LPAYYDSGQDLLMNPDIHLSRATSSASISSFAQIQQLHCLQL